MLGFPIGLLGVQTPPHFIDVGARRCHLIGDRRDRGDRAGDQTNRIGELFGGQQPHPLVREQLLILFIEF